MLDLEARSQTRLRPAPPQPLLLMIASSERHFMKVFAGEQAAALMACAVL